MKELSIKLISLYQVFVSSFLKSILGISSSCKFNPTCSAYAKQQIRKQGLVKGSAAFVKRLSTCHNISI